MKNWNKKQISKEQVRFLQEKYNIDALTASILTRRGISDGKQIQFYLETDARFLHNPFLFNNMEDVVDRIFQAKDENEKVLIFGDRDVDGITSTVVLYDCLTNMGLDVRCRLPSGTDPYGLNKKSIDEFANEYGTLIITVDCGISNTEEVSYASSLGMDVIVLDHHNPPDILPSPAVIIDPKCARSGYPFKDISGCAVAYKVVSALRFAKSDLYKNEIALLVPVIEGKDVFIEVLKVQNLVEKDFLREKITPGTSIMETKLIDFLQGQQIFVWDLKRTKQILDSLFGSGADFQMFDLSQEVAKKIPSMANMTLQNLRSKSKLARYNDEFDSEIKGFFNIFVTFVTMQLAAQYPKDASDDELDLQLVSLAALADIMPLTDENRILVTRGIAAMNNGKPRNGLIELLSLQELLGKRVNSIDLSWSIIPALNSTGRLGQPEVGLDLFLEKTAEKRMKLAKKIVEMNNERKRLGQEAYDYGLPKSKESVEKYGGKLCVVIDERINRGVSGILASKLVSFYNIPSMAITFVDDTAIGSMRSCRGFDATIFLDKMSDIFISHGGHNYAAGFSFKKENLPKFLSYLDQLYTNIQLDEPSTDTFEVDAELPPDFLTPNILKLVDKLEPYGESNRELLFMSRTLKITDYDIVGKVSKKQHLKLTLDCGKSKWPAIFWGGADYIHNEFEKGDFVDILYKINRNTFNGLETPQMIITDIRKSQK